MNRLRRIDRREKIRYRPASMYGPDPGDASVEHTYLRVREEIQRGIAAMRAYPNGGPRRRNASSPTR